MQIKLISEASNLPQLQDNWESIAKHGGLGVFYSWQWFSVIQENNPQLRLFLIEASDGGNPKSISPLCKGKFRLRYLILHIPLNCIKFISSPFSTFCDFIALKGEKEAFAYSFERVLKEPGWDIVLLSDIPENSETPNNLKELLTLRHKRFFMRFSSNCPYVQSPLDWKGYLAEQSDNYKEKIRKIHKKIERLGDVKFELHIQLDNVEEFYQQFLFIIKKSRAADKKNYKYNNPKNAILFLNLLKTANSQGWLRVWLMKKGSQLIAIEVDLWDSGQLHCISKVFDEDFIAYSPGSCLTWYILKYCLDSGYRYDFGPGGENYKLAWTKDIFKTYEFIIFQDNFKSALLYYALALKQGVKKILRLEQEK